MAPEWMTLLREEQSKPYWNELARFVEAERAQGAVYPAPDEVYAALELTAYADVKAVILGQDPYHQPGQAHGLSFSVREGVTPPPSLRNIFREMEADGFGVPNHGCLEHWAHQGVLLLNAFLTVREGDAGSHASAGWKSVTDQVLRKVDAKDEGVVFILWGNEARKKRKLISDHHHAIESPHPSPFSAYKGFFGSQPFSRANAALQAMGRSPIEWQIPDR